VNPDTKDAGSSSLLINEYLSSGKVKFTKETVRVIKIDDFVSENKVPKISFIKMDIEGFEYWAIQGMKKLINKWHPVMIIEYNNERMTFVGVFNNDMKKLLHDVYDCYEISKFDEVSGSYSLDPFNFNRHVQCDLLCVPKSKFREVQ
jgi:hypothetical protein